MKKTIYGKISFIIVCVYITFVLWGQYSLLDTIFPPLPFAVGIIVLAVLLTKLLFYLCSKWKPALDDERPQKKEMFRLALIVFGVSFVLFMVLYYSRFPGIYCIDSVNQLNQCITGNYSNWHPLLHTLLLFTLPAKTGALWLVEIIQIVFFCLALTYMICTLRYYGCPKLLCILCLTYILMQPDTTYIMLFPCKDSTFTILSLLLMTELVNVVLTKGRWIKKVYNLVFLIITVVVCTIIRHNAILFTLPLLIAVLYFSRREIKRCLICVVSVVALFLLIKIPLYGMFNIQKNTYRTTETMGMCIVMMGNAVHEADYLMSDEALSFMYSINDADSWDLVYSRGDWNMVKCEKSANWDVIEEAGRKKILDYTLDTLLRAPDQSIKAFLDVTGMIWKVDGDRPWLRAMDDYDSNYQSVLDAFDDSTVELMDKYDVNSVSALYINEVIQLYRATVRESFMKYIFCYIGLLNLILLVVCFAGIKEKGDLRKILYILPIMCYSYGTAILLSGYDLRFFSYTYVCFFPALFLLFKKNRVSDEENLDCE